MAPLKGNTLGEKHRTYNSILKELIAEGSAELTKINYNEDDIDNMMKIDIACNDRNVDYIMEVYKCDDMLYVTRAIKHSVWLITEPEYAHLINPDYLDLNVFPEMTTKAVAKLMLHIRRYLKDEKRTEYFFHYVEKKNPIMALKWLENCSVLFTEEIVERYADNISADTLGRLCKKSVNILRIYIKNVSGRNYVTFEKVMFLLKSNTEEFLDITEGHLRQSKKPNFNDKQTQILMKHSFQRIVNNFTDFRDRIDLPTFVRYLKKSNLDIKTFLLTRCNKCWLNFDNLKSFLTELDKDDNVALLRKLYGINNSNDIVGSTNKTESSKDEESEDDSNSLDTKSNSSLDADLTKVEKLFFTIEPNYSIFSEVYRWYEFTSFDIAFADLTTRIKTESSAEGRHSLLMFLLKNAQKNVELVRKVLNYYLDKYINEPYKFRILFINSVLSECDAFRFDDATWELLDNIFERCDVYIQSRKDVQYCLMTIIIRSVLLGLPVHRIVEQKFIFNTLYDFKKKLNKFEKEKVFIYLYNQLEGKLHYQELNTEAGLKKATALLVNIWTLIKDWKKEKTHHKFVIDYMIKLCNMNKKLSRDNMKYLYRSVKPYHKRLFENSLLLYPCENMCINALKHDPSLLKRYQAEVTTICCNDSVSLNTMLSKLRIYWQESLASEWKCTLMNKLQGFSGHKALIRNIFVLSSQQILLDFIKKYAPNDDKIHWSEEILIDVNLRKHIAKWMHLARPQLPVEVVLWYAKGDYLQFTLHSLNSIYCNLRSKDIDKHIKLLLSSPVSLQKHGIRVASKRLRTDELLQTFPSLWKSTRNTSIRAHLFTSAFKTLCDAETTLVNSSWEDLRFMIDNLNYQENQTIYLTFGNIEDIPLSVVGEFFEKSFMFLKDLPERFCCQFVFDNIIKYATNIIQYLDPAFVENTLLASVYDIFSQKNQEYLKILSGYLLCSYDEDTQMQKYKNIFEPLFKICVPKWKTNVFEPNVIDSFHKFLTYTASYLQRFTFKLNIIMPVKMLTLILSILESELCKEEQYRVITRWKLSTAYVQLLNDNKIMIELSNNLTSWEEVSKSSVEKYAEICIKYLKEDIEGNFPSIYILFADELNQVFKDFDITTVTLLNIFDNMLVHENLQVYMLVLNLLQRKNYDYDDTRYMEQVIKKKLYCFSSDELKLHYNFHYGKYNDFCEDNDNSTCASESNSDISKSSSQEDLSDVEDVQDSTCYLL